MHRHHRILIVDDHPTNVVVLAEILGHDYQLQTAASGAEALALAPDFQPDLILLDIMMPGIDGYETCRRIRTHPALRHTKVIMVSAKAMVTERVQGYEAGADDYITKPFDEDELLAKVRVYLRLKSVEEVDQLKSDMLALLSHETRTPLHGILAPVEMLRAEEAMDAAERAMLLDLAYQSAKNLLRFFERVTMLSMMKAGTWACEFAPADLCEVVRCAVGGVTSQAVTRHITIVQELPDAARTMLDRERMLEAITALLENAIRFSPVEGRVTVGVRQGDEHVCVTVTDQGAGIDPAFLPYVFEGLAAPDVRHHTEGHGLSLAIARQVVLAHHGLIGVESRQGAGATFTLRVPVASS